MPLTPEDVSNKRFTTVRLREGYDMTEVDQFLDEVEAELSRLLKENEALRGGDAAATPAPTAAPAPTVGPTDAPAEDEQAPAAAVDAPAAAPEVPAQAMPVSEPAASGGAAGRETLTVTTTAEASAAATRLLELAGRNADQLVEEAEQQAQQIVGEARTRAQELDVETDQRRESLLSDIERQKVELTGQIDGLRAFEREYRAELRTYFEDQLAALEGQGAGGVLSHSDRDPAPDVSDAEAGSNVAPEGAGDGHDGGGDPAHTNDGE
jgi:DivIVA domain-containing protein